MLSEAEKTQLAIYKEMATMNKSQALDFHELLMKEMAVVEALKEVVTAPIFAVEAKPKKRKLI